MTLKEYILHQFREMQREMLGALMGVSQEDLTSHAPAGHWPIAWIVLHCCRNVDFFIYKTITGELFLEYDDRFVQFPVIEPQPGDPYPTGEELQHAWMALTEATIQALEGVTEARLQQPRTHREEPLVESCLRVINHQNAHLRAIWCILGERRVDAKWPEQGPWLA